MANEKTYTARFNIEGNARSELEAMRDAGRDYADATDEAASSTEAATVQTESFTDRLNKLRVVYDQVISRSKEAVKQFAAEQASQGRLARVYDEAGVSAARLAKSEELLARNRDKGYGSIVEQREALRNLFEETKNVATAERDLALANDIASQEAISVTQASEAIAKARRGETEELKRFTGVSKTASQQLGQITDDGQRAAVAIDMLTDAYSGAAEANAGLEERMTAFSEQAVQVETAIGEIVVAAGDMTAKLLEVVSASDDGEISMKNFAKGMGEFARQTTEATTVLTGFLDEMTRQDIIEIAKGGGILSPDNVMRVINEVESRRQSRLALTPDGQPAGTGDAGTGGGSSKYYNYGPLFGDAPTKPKGKRKPKERERDFSGVRSLGDLTDEAAEELDAEIEALRAKEEQEQRVAFAKEMQLNVANEIARLELQGNEIAARRATIINSNLTPLQKAVELKKIEVELEEKAEQAAAARAAARVAMVDAAADATSGLIRSLGEGEAAERAASLVDGLKAEYKAILAFAGGNYASGIAYQAGAIKAFAVAGGGGGGGGASSAKTSRGQEQTQQRFNAEAEARRNARIFAETVESNRTTADRPIILNYRSVGSFTEREGMNVANAARKAFQTQVGGGRRDIGV